MDGKYWSKEDWSKWQTAFNEFVEAVINAAECIIDYVTNAIESIIENDLPEFVRSLPKRKYPPYKNPKIKPLYLDKRRKIHVCCRSDC